MKKESDTTRKVVERRLKELGMSKADLARASGVPQSTIGSFMSSANSNLRMDTARAIATALQMTVAELNGEAKPADEKQIYSANIPADNLYTNELMPVFAAQDGSLRCRYMIRGMPVDRIRKPAALQHAPNAYGIYVQGDEMAPRYCDGELIYLQPGLPCPAGSWVIVSMIDGTGLLRRLVARDEDGIHVEILSPARAETIHPKDVAALHRVVLSGIAR